MNEKNNLNMCLVSDKLFNFIFVLNFSTLVP